MTVLLSAITYAQINNSTTQQVKIYGICEMCKSNIEKAGNQKNIVSVNWDQNTHIASIAYDPKKTTSDQILKRIALAGYDNSSFLAPQSSYAKLPNCCKYTRDINNSIPKSEISSNVDASGEQVLQLGSFEEIYNSYFNLKDAFVRSNTSAVSANAKVFFELISIVKTESLTPQEQKIWLSVNNELANNAKAISELKTIEKQRNYFKAFSKSFYELMKAVKTAKPVYYQYCPMADASWLSKESSIKNPYYGAQMLNCGKIVETIQ